MPTNLRAATGTTGTVIDPATGDGVLNLYTGATAGSQVLAASFAADGTPTFLKGPVASMVRLNTANGYGSTSTQVRRFTTTVTNQGSDITYADSATLGATFTINTSGVYSVSYSDCFNAASSLGITKDSSALAVNFVNVPAAQTLIGSTISAANFGGGGSWIGYLPSGSVIRAQTDALPVGSNPSFTQFTITRVA